MKFYLKGSITTVRVANLKLLLEGTRVHESTIGHYKFYYPKDDEELLTCDVAIEEMPWAPYQGLVAVKIVGAFIEKKKPAYIVWVNAADIRPYN